MINNSDKTSTIKKKTKSALTKEKTIYPRERKFIENYIKTLNGTQSALASYNTTDYSTAGVIAHENLNKPKIKAEIERLLSENSIDLGDILKVHRRNLLQDKHLPTSQKAVTDFYEILGLKNSEKPQNDIKVAFVIEK